MYYRGLNLISKPCYKEVLFDFSRLPQSSTVKQECHLGIVSFPGRIFILVAPLSNSMREMATAAVMRMEVHEGVKDSGHRQGRIFYYVKKRF